MKKYTNNSTKQKVIKFEDGSGVFLKRGASYISDKASKFVDKGVKVSEVRKTKARTTTTTAKESTDDSTSTEI